AAPSGSSRRHRGRGSRRLTTVAVANADLSVVEDRLAAQERVHGDALHLSARVWRPPALGENVLVRDCVLLGRVDEYEVGVGANADRALLRIQPEELGWTRGGGVGCAL